MTIAAPPEAAFQAFTYHGGDVSAAARLFPDAPRPWIDLSTGINPHPYPMPAIPPEAWTRLPDIDALARLEALAASRYRARSLAQVVAAPGSQAIIQTLSRLLPARRVGVLAPTYQGHERAWGARIERVGRLEALEGHDVAIVVNPNNPDGRVVPVSALRELGRALASRGGVLIVDEAFGDFDAAGQSLAPEMPEAGAIVLRSFGKTYGLAGLRLGFAIASPDLAVPLRAAHGPWAVSGPAIEVASRALADLDWFGATRALLASEAEKLDRLLLATGWELIGGTRLFRLARRADARDRFLALLRAGLLARPFADAADRLRFGLPADEEAWERLARGLKAAS
jgi:cobalamin biosynthesis protein CobC